MHLSPHFKPALVDKGDRFMSHFFSHNPRDAYVAFNNGGFTVAFNGEKTVKANP